MNESCYTHVGERRKTAHAVPHAHSIVMSHIWMSHVTLVKESCHICEWVMSHTRRRKKGDCICCSKFSKHSYVTHMNESCHTCERVVSHMWMSHVPHTQAKEGRLHMLFHMLKAQPKPATELSPAVPKMTTVTVPQVSCACCGVCCSVYFCVCIAVCVAVCVAV
jgi:hypothetical protein